MGNLGADSICAKLSLFPKHAPLRPPTHLGNTLDSSTDTENAVGDTGDDLGDTSLDVGLGAEGSDGSSTTADDDTC